ncbi:hypothetical protein LGL55_17315 [Clostridium tagluense]|uniref:hypothetical protein n=1 Tax=Clostridium tagluense TaxID=360422 RepID=UPI001CF4B268|nr:hypothetical protein [Clostridium tagluense]MCB2312968.1 hypothetical protein [Clostridium tagluense]MCB2317794.1 hypothetical protein [Clostridium tagluense]MCB2322515.1 hypothetical protein [Clostridium tagluense]MCB2327577.1 hypothetical protein [Clostridium tagluense]MCB2333672.1 hypothetical protein [Clostridium tagluense]
MDAILSVRISDELKQKFNELAQSEGINNKELMEQVVKYYELNRAREEDSNMSEDIKELQTITSRMADIYINIVERNNIKALEVKNIHRNELVDKNNDLQKLKEEITLLKEENKKINALEKDLSDAKHISKDLQESIKSLKTLNNMQEEKILKLTETNEKYIKYKDEIVKLKTEQDKSTNENMQLNNELSNKNDEEARLIKQIDELKQINKSKINELEIKANQDIEMQRERTSFQMEKEILKLKEEQQLKIQELQESFNDRINKLLIEKEEVAEKFKNMIMQMNKNKDETEHIVIEKK